MIKFYYSTAPNPMKVALCLEEMGLAYEPMPVDTRKGEQHKSGYLAINPNAKVPAEAYPDENDRKAAALWPKSADVAAGYDLDDWIGGEIQVKYRQALAQFTRDQDVDKFIATMKQVDTRSTGG